MFNSRLILNRTSFFSYLNNRFYQNIKKYDNHLQLLPQQNTNTATKCSYSTIKKYTVFNEETVSEVFDVEEERQRNQEEESSALPDKEYEHEFVGLNLKRGVKNVFDIEDLVEVLHKENAEDVFVCSVHKSLGYVELLVVCSGRSYRHMINIAEFVRRMFKIKRHQSDKMPQIEGKNSRDWMAMDLGNIALHIMTAEAREKYDLESLWAIGPEYDTECNKPQDPIVELFQRHAMLLSDVPPNKNPSSNKVQIDSNPT